MSVTVLDDLVLGELLGEGGFAAVWASELDGAPVAVKISHRGTAAARQRVAREAAALERLGGVHAPVLLRWRDAAPRPYLVMSRVEAATRADWSGASALARAIAAIHAAGVVHGDLKPENLGGARERVTLLDFGSASLPDAPGPGGGSVEYMAPELWRGAAASAASDVYALGALLYAWLAERPLFTGEARTVGYQHMMMRPDLGGVSSAAAVLLARCLAKDPALRPAAREVADALAAISLDDAFPRRAERSALARRERRCVVVVAEIEAAAPAIAQVIERHRGALLLVRGRRVVAAWDGADGDPARGAIAAARELHQRHGARACVGIERIPCDRETPELLPERANIEPAWLLWPQRGVIGTAELAALGALPAAGGFVELTEGAAGVGVDGSGDALADPAAFLERALGVERIPGALLQRLLALGDGNRRRLGELAAHLKASGAVRQRGGLERAYLAPEAVTLPDPDRDLDDWLAEAALAALPAELRAIVAVCALLEPGFELGEVSAAVDALDHGGIAVVDPGTALVELALRGVAILDGTAWRLASAALARTAARTAPDPVCAAAAALAYGDQSWTGQLDERRRRALARYAAAIGDRARAAALWLALADDGRRAHRDIEAEADFTAALDALADGDADARAAALLGRGVVRYRLDRAADALVDLAAAERLARGDRARQARAQLEIATATDWLGRYDDSARACDDAARTALQLPGADPAFARALAMARGRCAVRAGRYADARGPLEAAIEIEGPDPDDDRLIAQLLLGPALVQVGELDAAERSFAAALAEAARLGDGLARCAALSNRVLLWSARRDHTRARADLEAARALARQLGHAVPERNATLNLAEYLYWAGELAEAARLAADARELQRRLVAEPLEDELLIARIAAARGELAEARAALARTAAVRRAISPALRCLRDAVAAVLDPAGSDLDRLEAAAREHLVGEELIEVLACRCAAHALRSEHAAAQATVERARALGPTLQGWRLHAPTHR